MFFNKFTKAVKPFYNSIRQLYTNRSYGYEGVNEITGSEHETDIFKELFNQHGVRLESAMKILTEMKISTTFKERSEETKQSLRVLVDEIVKFLAACDADSRSRALDNSVDQDIEEAKTQARLAKKPLGF